MDDILREVAEAALLAPSADNTQPWEIHLGEKHIDLYHVPARDITPYDDTHRASLVAHGAFIENARIAAARLGYETAVSISEPSPQNRWHLARLTLSHVTSSSANGALYQHIATRVTNRKPYASAQISEMQTQALGNVQAEHGLRVQILQYPQAGLARAVATTEQISFQNKHVHKALFEHIRWNDAGVHRTRDGFSIDTFELPVIGRLIFAAARSWSRLSFLNRTIGIAASLPTQVSEVYRRSGAFVGIVGTANSASDWVRVGQLVERLWLTATSLDLSVQPVGAILFFKRGIDEKTTRAFSDSEKVLIYKACADIRSAFEPKRSEDILFIMRVGVAPPPSARTIRYQLSQITKNDI